MRVSSGGDARKPPGSLAPEPDWGLMGRMDAAHLSQLADGSGLLSRDGAALAELFDHVPDTVFFLKDRGGRYLAVNQSFVERVGALDRRSLMGRHVKEVFPAELAVEYAAQDDRVLQTGRPLLDRLELHWYSRRRKGWCLTTKLPLRNAAGVVVGLVGISRDLRAPGDAEMIPKSLASTLEYLESNFSEVVSPARLAARAGLTPARFARLIKRIFRLTPSQLITQTRLAAASRLLEESDRPVADVALECGFYDHSAFTRAFRSALGLTPSAFRRQARGDRP
jgi:PAS domain S-box-containing protein